MMPISSKPGPEQILNKIEGFQELLEVKDSVLAELYVSHISQRQTVRTEYTVKRSLLGQRHEEETIRMESDILKIKADMDLLEQELEQLVAQTEGSILASICGSVEDKTPSSSTSSSSSSKCPSFSLPCPVCPVCQSAMTPPMAIFQCSNGHLVCESCHGKMHVTTCRTCLGEFVGRATGMEQYLQSLFTD